MRVYFNMKEFETNIEDLLKDSIMTTAQEGKARKSSVQHVAGNLNASIR